VFRSFYSKLFYFYLSFYFLSSDCFIMGEQEIEIERGHKYRLYGAVYVIFGLWIFFYFSWTNLGNFGNINFWRFVSSDAWDVVGVLYCFVLFFSFVLVVFGVFLLDGDYLVVARVSVVLAVFLLLSYLVAMFYPLFFLSY